MEKWHPLATTQLDLISSLKKTRYIPTIKDKKLGKQLFFILNALRCNKVTPSSLQLIENFLQAGADPNYCFNSIDPACNTLLLEEAFEGDIIPAIIDLLLKYGLDVNIKNKFGEFPLYYYLNSYVSVTMGIPNHRIPRADPAIVRMLMKHGSTVNAANKEGRSILMMAAKAGVPEIIELLLKKPQVRAIEILPQEENSYLKRLPHELLPVIKEKINAADPIVKDNNGNTALQYAEFILNHFLENRKSYKKNCTCFDVDTMITDYRAVVKILA